MNSISLLFLACIFVGFYSAINGAVVNASQFQGFSFFNSAGRQDLMGEKGIDDLNKSVNVEAATVSTSKKTTKATGKKNNGQLDMIIAAPVVTNNDNITDGVYVNPKDNTFNIAIGGANISIDLNNDQIKSINSTAKPLNGEQIPDSVKGKLPLFLQLANDTSRRSFFDIETNGNIKKLYYMQALVNWANAQGDNVKQEFFKYSDAIKAQNAAVRQEQANKVASMSKAAQSAHQKIQDILDNDQISKNEENQQIMKILNNLPLKVQNELNALA